MSIPNNEKSRVCEKCFFYEKRRKNDQIKSQTNFSTTQISASTITGKKR